jgi:non-specific protein-tyrosine kinase
VLAEGPVAPLLGRLAANPAAADAVRNVCASILLSQSSRPPRVIAVTSAVPGEGKTTLVSELGQAFADGGAKTLLVECDLRRPTFGSVFNVGHEGGLSLYLAGHTGAAPAIHPTSNGNLFVVAAGPSTPNPPALLNSDKMRTFLREMTAKFQFVILDSPPLIPMADARVVAAMAEGVVLVVRAGYVPKPLVRRMCAMLESTGATVLGAVLNGTDPQGPESPYYRYYRHYYESEQAG